MVVGFILVQSCSNNGGESGVQDDGFKGASDSNGGLPNTEQPTNPQTDTARGEHRVDTEKRYDSSLESSKGTGTDKGQQ